jgi:putative ABC transport system permease protein
MLGRRRQTSDFSAEIEAHVQLETERLREQGMSEQDARAAARRAFGNLTQVQEHFYERGRWVWWDHLSQDIRFGLRMLAKSPGFTATAVLTLALAIGANTAIFSAVYAVLLKPLPFKDSGRLVFIEKKNPPRGWERNPISPAEILAWRNQSGAFNDVAAYTQRHCVLTGTEQAEEDPCEVISSNLFLMLGLTPIRGQTFSADADRPEGPRLAILSHELWQRRFAADESVIGRAIDIDGASYTIVGIMPPNFSHWYAPPYHAVSESFAQLWLSGIALSPTIAWNDYFGIGRLKSGISLPQAAAQMDAVSARIDGMYPELKGWRAQLVSLRAMSSRETRPALLVLMAATIFVLLIACANIANLLLARGASRASEFAVRNALGASQGRIVRQLLTESFVVSVTGGVLGILLASWGSKALVASAPASLLKSAPGLAGGPVNLRVLIFSFVTVVLTTVFFGLAPALQSAHPHLTETLKETGRSSLQSLRNRRFRNALVVSEIAVALVLLVGAGLMVRTLAQLRRVNLGFNPSNVLTLRVPLSGERYKEPQAQAQFWERALSAVQSLPGVEAATVSLRLPVNGWSGQFFTIAEDPNPAAGQVPTANYVIVGPGYFRTMQIPLRRGRSFNEHDTQSGDRVVIVNEELARLYWPGRNPIGKRLRVGAPTAPWLSVVGVAGNVLTQGPDAGFNPEIYVPYQQYPWLLGGPKHLVVRTTATVKPESLTHAVVQQVHNLDKDVPVTDIATMELVAEQTLAQQRMVMALLVSFAALALVLSALGIYSVLSYSVAQRTREIGLRVALGAERAGVLRLVVGGGARLAILGIALGIAAALVLTQLMTDLLYGVRATDPLTFGAVATLLAATSLLASYIPARRALNVDPIVALRYE